MSKSIRGYFLEYLDRFRKAGPDSFPTSFNVVESFLFFSEEWCAYDIGEEREHLLSLEDYIDWYTSGQFPDEPKALTELLPDGVVHEYNILSPREDFSLETIDSKLCVLGIALVRHGAELSTLVLAGECPAFPPDTEIDDGLHVTPTPGREDLRPHPSLGLTDRYFAQMSDHARVVLLTRFDLERRRFDVRYVNIDLGRSYMVLSDDPFILDDPAKRYRRRVAVCSRRYVGGIGALCILVLCEQH